MESMPNTTQIPNMPQSVQPSHHRSLVVWVFVLAGGLIIAGVSFWLYHQQGVVLDQQKKLQENQGQQKFSDTLESSQSYELDSSASISKDLDSINIDEVNTTNELQDVNQDIQQL